MVNRNFGGSWKGDFLLSILKAVEADHYIILKRKMYLVIFPIIIAANISYWFFSPYLDPILAAVLPGYTLLLFMFWIFMYNYWFFHLVEMICVVLFAMYHLFRVYTLMNQLDQDIMNVYIMWSPLYFIYIFMALERKKALGFSLFLLCITILMGASHFQHARAMDTLIQYYITTFLFIIVLFYFQRIVSVFIESDILRRKNKELERMESSRRQLMANISHDLGTPMTVIQGYVKAMVDGVVPRDDHKYLMLVYEKIVLMNRLIQDLFQLSKLEARQLKFQFVPISAGELVQQIMDKFAIDVQENGLHLMVSESTWHGEAIVQVDLQRIEQVFVNLIYNAIKYTPEGGNITIGVMESESFVDRLVFQVSDTGVGIPDKELPYLFNRFYSVERDSGKQFESSGLGLSIVKEIIKTHGGEVWATSAINKGSTFYFTLPKVLNKDACI